MTGSDTDYDVVIVGGGVAGCASAYHLSPDHDVAIVERGQIAGEASGLAAGLVAPTLFHGEHPDVARFANKWFRAFDGTQNFSFHERPRIEFIQPDSERAARDRAANLSAKGFPVSFLDPAEVEEAYPWFDASRFAGVVEYADTGWVDPYEYTVALQKAAEERGVDVFRNTPVRDVSADDGVATVELPESSLSAEYCVMATGWRTREFLSGYLDLPIRPFHLQCAMLRLEEPLDETFPLGRVAREELYFRGELNGDLLVGGGEYLEDTPEVNASGSGTDDEFRLHVASTIPTVIRGAERAEFVDGWSGVDAATPDTLPLLGSSAALPDEIVVATGLNGLGMVNSPIAAETIRSYITGAEAAFSVEPFAVDRFDGGGADFELRGTFEMEGAGR
ncbi:NAD(P)/FAD-dependent oxidoreductase [Haloferax sp. DFSO52]|uniref:NAD(P)/FAD-dependent oxidoreductase n=1 Tax=Haloferax sp. DFSO52 TaxID=3388505 RepID=UPI003A86EBC9